MKTGNRPDNLRQRAAVAVLRREGFAVLRISQLEAAHELRVVVFDDHGALRQVLPPARQTLEAVVQHADDIRVTQRSQRFKFLGKREAQIGAVAGM